MSNKRTKAKVERYLIKGLTHYQTEERMAPNFEELMDFVQWSNRNGVPIASIEEETTLALEALQQKKICQETENGTFCLIAPYTHLATPRRITAGAVAVGEPSSSRVSRGRVAKPKRGRGRKTVAAAATGADPAQTVRKPRKPRVVPEVPATDLRRSSRRRVPVKQNATASGTRSTRSRSQTSRASTSRAPRKTRKRARSPSIAPARRRQSSRTSTARGRTSTTRGRATASHGRASASRGRALTTRTNRSRSSTEPPAKRAKLAGRAVAGNSSTPTPTASTSARVKPARRAPKYPHMYLAADPIPVDPLSLDALGFLFPGFGSRQAPVQDDGDDLSVEEVPYYTDEEDVESFPVGLISVEEQGRSSQVEQGNVTDETNEVESGVKEEVRSVETVPVENQDDDEEESGNVEEAGQEKAGMGETSSENNK